jgi:formylglycine-generating enzyme required for sulfatase activity
VARLTGWVVMMRSSTKGISWRYVVLYFLLASALCQPSIACVMAGEDSRQGDSSPATLEWAEVVEASVDPKVVTLEPMRRAIEATGLPWRVRHRTTGIELLLVPPGEFVMGRTLGDEERPSGSGIDTVRDPKELPAHRVVITKPFYLGRFEVTESQWLKVMGDLPQVMYPRAGAGPRMAPEEVKQRVRAPGARRAIDEVSWDDAMRFCQKVGSRLPTEAEWEYACRAGLRVSRHGSIDDVAWYSGNSKRTNQIVGGKLANELGFHDMLGNVGEWVSDWFGAYPEEDQIDPQGPRTGEERVQRGGGYDSDAYRCRASSRARCPPGFPSDGFRIAITPPAIQLTRAGVGVPAPATRVPKISQGPDVASWAEVIEPTVDAKVVTDGAIREAIQASGLPWRVRHRGSGIEMLLVPAGKFVMGGSHKPTIGPPPPENEVVITKPFYLGRFEVKQSEWVSVTGRNPSRHRDKSERARRIEELMAEGKSRRSAERDSQHLSDEIPGLPVDSVSWDDCMSFCATAGLRLPTEAEWEYACRAGSADYYRYGPVDRVAWHRENSGRKPHPVGLKQPNALGFCDMLGNVQEWVSDWMADYSTGRQIDPTGPASGKEKVLRGGSFERGVDSSVMFERRTTRPGEYSSVGLRVARDP